MRKLIFALAMTLCLLFTFTIGASAHTVQKVHATQNSSQTAPPPGYPTNCLVISASDSNVSRTSTALSYNVHARVRNGCTKVLLGDGSGGWIANFVVDCDGDMTGENPELTGGLPQLNVSASFTFLDGHYTSFCEDQFGDKFAPSEVVIYLSASGNLQGGGVATGNTYVTIS